jgi:hypothetical protein
MRIQLEIDEKDLALLVNAFISASSNQKNDHPVSIIQKAIRGITDIIDIGAAAFAELEDKLAPYTDGSPVLPASDFRTQLGISDVFIKSDTGLIMVLNYVLKFLVNTYKNGAKPVLIKKDKIDEARTMQDLVNLITANYEKSK